MNIAVITGGAGGMGLALARFEAKNRKVVLVDVSEERLKQAQNDLHNEGLDVDYVVCDVSDCQAVKDLAENVSKMGKIDAVFHTAGINRGSVEKIIAVDAMGTYYMIEEFYKVLEPGSNMVTVSSLASHFFKKTATEEIIQLLDHPEDPNFESNMVATAKAMAAAAGGDLEPNAYTIAKLFVWRYTRRNAKRFWTKEIRINTVTPGIISTPMALADKDGSAYASSMMVIQRFGTPKEMASVMHYLGSELAGDITGVDFAVDGGFTCLQEFDQI